MHHSFEYAILQQALIDEDRLLQTGSDGNKGHLPKSRQSEVDPHEPLGLHIGGQTQPRRRQIYKSSEESPAEKIEAEGRRRSRPSGATEKEQLSRDRGDMEEKEQVPQARDQLLQADNHFSNEARRLQVGGDSTRIQLLIECPPVKQLKETVSSSIHKLANFDEVMDAHLQNNQTAEDDILASPDRLKAVKY
ncbi:sarcolemmal membrane-associated protein isoform X6 [Lates japonicus]|uniref:Sarcolemmal membrane-associated protein isoform X6 n=1 Tax=Lates japonicus TaxID=270547 RepID=A0AAD3RK69_LATJO|nr:sarcolemmal membrane-associated protein isoform X6 [Lates japonicus]